MYCPRCDLHALSSLLLPQGHNKYGPFSLAGTLDLQMNLELYKSYAPKPITIKRRASASGMMCFFTQVNCSVCCTVHWHGGIRTC